VEAVVSCSEHSKFELEVETLKEACASHEKRLSSLEGLKLMAIGACFAWGPLCALVAFLWRYPQAVTGARALVGVGQP
jgi:hypothetical protein